MFTTFTVSSEALLPLQCIQVLMVKHETLSPDKSYFSIVF